MKKVVFKTIGTMTCCLAMAWVTLVSEASQMEHREVSDLAVEATTIALGRCVETSSQRVDGSLMTLLTIDVEESLKGAGPETVTVVVPGGIDVAGPVPVAVSYPGAPTILPDEDVLLFLDDSPVIEGGHQIVGFSQGKYSVIDDGSGGRVVAKSHHVGTYGTALDDIRSEILQALAEAGSEN